MELYASWVRWFGPGGPGRLLVEDADVEDQPTRRSKAVCEMLGRRVDLRDELEMLSEEQQALRLTAWYEQVVLPLEPTVEERRSVSRATLGALAVLTIRNRLLSASSDVWVRAAWINLEKLDRDGRERVAEIDQLTNALEFRDSVLLALDTVIINANPSLPPRQWAWADIGPTVVALSDEILRPWGNRRFFDDHWKAWWARLTRVWADALIRNTPRDRRRHGSELFRDELQGAEELVARGASTYRRPRRDQRWFLIAWRWSEWVWRVPALFSIRPGEVERVMRVRARRALEIGNTREAEVWAVLQRLVEDNQRGLMGDPAFVNSVRPPFGFHYGVDGPLVTSSPFMGAWARALYPEWVGEGL